MIWIPVIFTALCWLLSARRTPAAIAWLAGAVPVSAGGMLMVASAEAVHHTLPGVIAVTAAGCAIPAAFTIGIEATASEGVGTSPSDIGRWRQEHPGLVRVPRRARPVRWVVRTYSAPEGVNLYIEAGSARRSIGTADPLTDMDAFMELRVKADQAAETMNALKIGTGE